MSGTDDNSPREQPSPLGPKSGQGPETKRSARIARLDTAAAAYAHARTSLLRVLNLEDSNRDPLAELSERLVLELVAGTLPASRVQHSYDVIASDGRHIQVKYLANPSDRWVNEHHIRVNVEMDEYAIVFFEALLPVTVISFPAKGFAQVAAALQKRHPDQTTTLQLTRRDYLRILQDPTEFCALGVRIYRSPDWLDRESAG